MTSGTPEPAAAGAQRSTASAEAATSATLKAALNSQATPTHLCRSSVRMVFTCAAHSASAAQRRALASPKEAQPRKRLAPPRARAP